MTVMCYESKMVIFSMLFSCCLWTDIVNVSYKEKVHRWVK